MADSVSEPQVNDTPQVSTQTEGQFEPTLDQSNASSNIDSIDLSASIEIPPGEINFESNNDLEVVKNETQTESESTDQAQQDTPVVTLASEETLSEDGQSNQITKDDDQSVIITEMKNADNEIVITEFKNFEDDDDDKPIITEIHDDELEQHLNEDFDFDELHIDELEETLFERLYGLTEMFPESLRNGVCTLSSKTVELVQNSYSLTRSVSWFFFSTSAIMFVPFMLEIERANLKRAFDKQMLMGSGSQTPGGLMGMPPPPTMSK